MKRRQLAIALPFVLPNALGALFFWPLVMIKSEHLLGAAKG
ncbi:hypothetical protein [Armatimonas sp.]|nr:hypothetical protein [Armatimonas sp.]